MSDSKLAGFSLIEAVIVLAVVGFVVALATPSMDQWLANNRLGDSARSVNAAFSFARSEAIRTGNLHAVFFDKDAGGNDLQDASANDVSSADEPASPEPSWTSALSSPVISAEGKKHQGGRGQEAARRKSPSPTCH